MSTRLHVVAVVIGCCGLFPCAAIAQPQARQAVVIDTDIGTGMEDPFALLLALGSEKLDVRGVTAVGDPAAKRGLLLCRLLTMSGRRNIRVAAGADPQPARPITDQSKYHYHPDPLFDRTTKPDKQPAHDFLMSVIKQQPGKVTIVALGPLTNVAKLLETHADAGKLVQSIVLLESNVSADAAAAKKVLSSGVPVVLISSAACKDAALSDADVERVLAPGTALTRQIEALYQMWDQSNPPLCDVIAVAFAAGERTHMTVSPARVSVDDAGKLSVAQEAGSAQVVTKVDAAGLRKWYVDLVSSWVSPSDRPSQLVERGGMPHRVHVTEDFENDIERFWWMSGKPETKLLPPGSTRACRGVLTHDFDDLLMVSRNMYSAVVFNPVPGPPMGPRTRLSFRYWLKGTDTIRVQLYSLSNGYHRHLVVKGLPQEKWGDATVDMTQMRRPDGTGGPLSENERIDDIQYYVDPRAQVIIDDIVLYEAEHADAGRASGKESKPFPRRIYFTGTFDTGKQGEHWPGDFTIVPDAGNFWRAAKSVAMSDGERPWLRVGLRGQRAVGDKTAVFWRYKWNGADEVEAKLRNSKSGLEAVAKVKLAKADGWSEASVEFDTAKLKAVDEVQLLLPMGAEMWVDDLLVYEP